MIVMEGESSDSSRFSPKSVSSASKSTEEAGGICRVMATLLSMWLVPSWWR